MKIVLISQSYPPMISGAAIMVQNLAQGLADDGHEVLVLAASDKTKSYTEQVGRLRVQRLPSIHNPTRANQRFLFAPLLAMRRAIAEFQPDIIHMHEALSLGLCGLVIAREMRVPTILTLHQLPWFPAAYLPPWPWLREGVTAALWRYGDWFVRRCTAVTVPAVTIAQIVKEHTGICPVPIYHGLDLSKFSPQAGVPLEEETLRQKYGLAPHAPIVLHVGRLDKEKQVDKVLRAFALLPQEVQAQLLVVGDGCVRQDLIKLSQRLGIEQRSIFPGYVYADGDLPGLYRLATVFVTASEIELFALVVLEAMASGLPVVAVSATSLPEIIEPGHNGFLAPSGDSAALAAHMNWFLQHSNDATQMSKLCRQKVVNYGLEQVVCQFENLYGQVAVAYHNQVRVVYS